ncbi:hypothetical protein [Salinivibrio kushneri]|uniref:hypothetical protein n=1 Tax=Salinivibrio kushneri TaxID=1908198 RepID=UPI000988D11F|nr:hypothetical protein [Salinivibrio kushneri]OOE69352.1 hypothetical protein BZG19_07825 [Salinivibrio kushneri]
MALLVVFVPVFVNSLTQLMKEVLNYTVEKVRLHYSELDLEVAENNARKEYAPKRIEKEHENEISQIRLERNNFEKQAVKLSNDLESCEKDLKLERKKSNDYALEVKSLKEKIDKLDSEKSELLNKYISMNPEDLEARGFKS